MKLNCDRSLLFLLFLSGISFSTAFFYWYLASKRKKKLSPTRINEVLTFADAAPSSKEPNRSRPLLHPSTERILDYLNLARYSVDVCMEMITSLDMACQLMDLHHRGVKLRIIVDSNLAYTPASAIELLENQGVAIYLASVDTMFRNFCLIDVSTVSAVDTVPFIMFGSPPWSKEALSGENDEIVFVTSRNVFIDVFKDEFERIYAAAI